MVKLEFIKMKKVNFCLICSKLSAVKFYKDESSHPSSVAEILTCLSCIAHGSLRLWQGSQTFSLVGEVFQAVLSSLIYPSSKTSFKNNGSLSLNL